MSFIKNNTDGYVDDRTIEYVWPKKVVWSNNIDDSDVILESRTSQASIEGKAYLLMKKGSAILLDFGYEMQGGIQVITGMWPGNVRTADIVVTFGESAMEAMSDKKNSTATNDHAIRASKYTVSWLGMTEIGNTGFRFVRIELLDDIVLPIQGIRAKFQYRKIEETGYFKCNDQRINDIFDTAAYTVQLNMQEYVWDGIKRDRLVWIGDMHPETSTIQYVFGKQKCVEKSLDLARDNTPLPRVMNGIPAYSLWWILIHHDYYMHFGDIEYLSEQREYLIGLIHKFEKEMAEDGKSLIENVFLDWPSSENTDGQAAGVHALMIIAYRDAAFMLRELGEEKEAEFAENCAKKLSQYTYDSNGLKQAISLQVLSGKINAIEAFDKLLGHGCSSGFSTFLGYYILQAQSKSGNTEYALECMKEYWGGMLDLGATTFWEDFDITWAENSIRIDELLDEGSNKQDIHGGFGGYCYKGYRHSLCHGWAAGPAPYLMEYVLGVKPIAPGFKVARIQPSLGNLEYAEGRIPTPYGFIYVKHKKIDGKVITEIDAPKEIEIIEE